MALAPRAFDVDGQPVIFSKLSNNGALGLINTCWNNANRLTAFKQSFLKLANVARVNLVIAVGWLSEPDSSSSAH